FCFSSRRRHTRSDRDWSSDVCSSDLGTALPLLIKCMNDTNAGVRVNAALAVYRIGGNTDEPVRVLIEAFKASSPTDRGNAASLQIGRASCRERGESCEVGVERSDDAM